MHIRSLLLSAILSCFTCVAWGDDVANTVTHLKKGFTQSKIVDERFEQRDGIWRLVRVGIESGHVTDSSLEHLAALKTVECLGLEGNRQVTSQGFEFLAALPNLRRFGTDWALTADEFRSISLLPELQDLSLCSNDRDRLEDEGLAYLTNLRRLYVAQVDLADSSMKYLSRLRCLHTLSLEHNSRITDAGLAELKDLVNLREFTLAHNTQITDAGMSHLTALVNLQELNLSSSSLVTDVGLAKLKSLRNLRHLEICDLGPTGLVALKGLSHLEHLGIRRYRSEEETADFSVLTGLKSLNIDSANYNHRGQVRLPPDLERLYLWHAIAAHVTFQSAKHIRDVRVNLGRSLFGNKEVRDLKWLSSLPELRELTLVGPNESDVVAISGLSTLRTLKIEPAACVPAIGNKGMRALAGLRNLESLTIAEYYCGGDEEQELDAGLDVLPKLTNLRRLELLYLPTITSKGLANICSLNQLRVLKLNVASRRLDASLDETLADMKVLVELEELSLPALTRMKLTDEGLKNLASLKKLCRLDLGKTCGYTDDALVSLMRALPSLQVVTRSYESLANQAERE